jgi:hypothetical protein
MKVHITFDYELFFGQPTGSVEKCILEPTEELIRIAEKHKVGFTYFVDVGYLIALERFMKDHPNLEKDYTNIINQLRRLIAKGNDIQLHIHPHWEKANYNGKDWMIDAAGNYKLDDFSDDEIARIVKTYKTKLEDVSQKQTPLYRAGGWCLQPFSRVKEIFKQNNINIDSTVFQGGYYETEHYYFDFRNAPMKGKYNFEDDLCKEDENGFFTEYPIGGWKYNPLFYWNLYIRGRLNPKAHKMIGDGNFIPQPGRKWKNLTSSNWNHVSCDGYFASKLKKVTSHYHKKGRTNLVIIGHPKSQTEFSFKKLDDFLSWAKHNGVAIELIRNKK